MPANGKVNLVMETEATALDEVVVTALGIKRAQKALSYNVQTVNGDALTSNKDANFINSLAGKVAGVNISSGSAGAGAAARVVMRGTKSLTGNDNALYVIDGIPMFDVNTGDEKAVLWPSSPVQARLPTSTPTTSSLCRYSQAPRLPLSTVRLPQAV